MELEDNRRGKDLVSSHPLLTYVGTSDLMGLVTSQGEMWPGRQCKALVGNQLRRGPMWLSAEDYDSSTSGGLTLLPVKAGS